MDVKVVHFREDFWGNSFLALPENAALADTLQLAKRGLQLLGKEQKDIAQLISHIIEREGSRKIIALMEALLAIHACKAKKQLVSVGFHEHFYAPEHDRMHAVYEYTLSNFKEKISLGTISAVAGISPNSFCKYFKVRSKRTYSDFLNEIRVSHACKLLMDGHLNVKQICYESGFYNFASFHQYFKRVTGKSPLQYQKSIAVC
ncbi:YSIRK-targeted surface antigen transcriptional regulator [compost metagenome]